MSKNYLSVFTPKGKNTRVMEQALQAFKVANRNLKGRLNGQYQREGVYWLLHRELSGVGHAGGFLCDEMGLGKTIQIIATMIGNPKESTLLVVPKTIVNQWVTELEKFAPQLRVKVHEGSTRTKDPSDFNGFDVVIAPYSVLTTKGKSEETVLHKRGWGRLVLDEGHEIRNPKSKIHKSMCNIQAGIKWILSGTPVYNSINDFVSLCKFIGLTRNEVLAFSKKIKADYVMRRTKEDVAEQNIRMKLPNCIFENVELEMNEDEKDLYNMVFRHAQERVREILRTSQSAGMRTMAILECLLRCRQAMIHPQLYINGMARKNNEAPEEWDLGCRKTEYLLEKVLSHPSEKSLIFSQFVNEMDLLNDLFLENNISVFRIDGSVPPEKRIEAVDQFRKCTKHCVFLIQIKAGGQGLNLQEATRVYITSPAWNPATELQAIGRSHRTGQTKQVVVNRLIYNGYEDLPSIEHSIMALQGTKSIVCASVLNDERLIQQIPTRIKNKNNITIRDLKKIFLVL
jgi:SNF2 family DNA or RNA helicase